MKRLLAVLTAAVTGSAFAEFIYQSTITPPAGESEEVAFPAGVYSNAEPMKIELPSTLETSVRLYGPQTTWIVPDRGSDYPAYPFHVTVNGNDAVYLKPAATLLAKSPFRFENFDFTTFYRATGKHFKNVFTGGSYNFYDPNGSVPATVPEIYFDQKNGSDLAEYIFNGVTNRMGKVFLSGTTAGLYRMVFNGGSHAIANDLQIGNSSAKEYEVLITNKATVAMTGGEGFRFNACKRGIVYIEDSSVSVTPTERYLGNSTSTDWTFAAKNSSISFAANLNLNGFTDKDGDKGVFALTNSLLTVSGMFGMNDDLRVEFVDCVVTNGSEYRVGNHANTTGDKVRIAYRGSNCRSYVAGDVRFGDQAGLDAEVEFAGGYHRFSCAQANWKIGEHSSSVINLKVSGGTVERRTAADAYVPFELGYTAGAQVDLELSNGGMIIASAISKKAVGTTVNFTADGGTFKAGVGGTIVSGLDSAVIGANGFTIDTGGKAITNSQSFTGTGALTLTGGGSVTFTAGVTCAVPVVVKGGTLLNLNGVSPKGLTVGDANSSGGLLIAAGSPITVDGNIDIVNVALTLSGSFVRSVDPYSLLSATGTVSESSLEAWQDAAVNSGITAEDSAIFSMVTEGGNTVFRMAVTEPQSLLIEVPEGQTLVTNQAIVYAQNDTLTVRTHEGATLEVGAAVKRGAFIKEGSGTLKLDAPETFAVRSNACVAGTVAFANENPVVLGWSFYLNTPDITNVFTVDCLNGVTMPLMTPLNGGLVKKGPGALAFTYDSATELRSKTVSGTAATTIQEGELAFRGIGGQRKITYSYFSPNIGDTNAVVSATPAQPGLVFDSVDVNAAASAFKFPIVFSGTETYLSSPYLYVTNNAKLLVMTIDLGDYLCGGTSDLEPRIRVDNSTLNFNYRFQNYGVNGGHVKIEVRNLGTWAMDYSDLRGDLEATFDNSTLTAYTAGSVAKFGYAAAACTNRWEFRNGSMMRVGTIQRPGTETNKNAVCRLLFDNSDWQPTLSTTEDFTFDYGQVSLGIAVSGAGLRLTPPAGCAWTMREPVRDAEGGCGGLVKRGTGTLVLDARYKCYTGTTRIEEGVLDMNGTTWTNAYVAGKGSLVNGTLQCPVIDFAASSDREEANLFTFNSADVSVVGQGVIDFGATPEAPLAFGDTFTFAKYAGVAPVNWKAVNTGLEGSVISVTATEEGTLIAKVIRSRGMTLSLR